MSEPLTPKTPNQVKVIEALTEYFQSCHTCPDPKEAALMTMTHTLNGVIVADWRKLKPTLKKLGVASMRDLVNYWNKVEFDPAKTNITQEMADLFEAIRDPSYTNFGLISCFMNGEAAVAIGAFYKHPDGTTEIKPLFVSLTPSMVLTDHDGQKAVSAEENIPVVAAPQESKI